MSLTKDLLAIDDQLVTIIYAVDAIAREYGGAEISVYDREFWFSEDPGPGEPPPSIALDDVLQALHALHAAVRALPGVYWDRPIVSPAGPRARPPDAYKEPAP